MVSGPLTGGRPCTPSVGWPPGSVGTVGALVLVGGALLVGGPLVVVLVAGGGPTVDVPHPARAPPSSAAAASTATATRAAPRQSLIPNRRTARRSRLHAESAARADATTAVKAGDRVQPAVRSPPVASGRRSWAPAAESSARKGARSGIGVHVGEFGAEEVLVAGRPGLGQRRQCQPRPSAKGQLPSRCRGAASRPVTGLAALGPPGIERSVSIRRPVATGAVPARSSGSDSVPDRPRAPASNPAPPGGAGRARPAGSAVGRDAPAPRIARHAHR